jgi:acetyl-CoA synthetase
VTYEQLHGEFRWDLPERFNMGVACSDAQPSTATALVEVTTGGAVREHTFGELAEQSNRLANGLAGIGVGAGDRVGIVLPQRVETGLAHLALAKLGAVAVPLSGLFGPDALRYRLGDSGARAVLTDARALEPVAEVAAELEVEVVVASDDVAAPHHRFDDLVTGASSSLGPADTTPDTPGLLIYTSGTTGPPKGALHGHRVLLGHLPGYELMFDFFPQTGDRVWTPADWAWIGGLMDALMPAWYHGKTVVGAPREGFDPQWAMDLMAAHRVRVAFLPPTALKLMRQADARSDGVALRAAMSGGEALGEAMLDWGREHLGVTINEIFGQTEANLVVGNSASVWEVRPGSMGRPYPGHDVAVLDDDGKALPPDEVGEVAVRAPDPVMFLEYWNRPEATAEKVRDGWLRTGDLARADADGYLWFASRNDDVINSAGYRIGPAEIEECLIAHPAVAMAAAVGIPDEVRGQVVKAFIVLAAEHQPGEELEADIAAHVRSRLAAYEYPRQIEFVTDLPLTTTGKIRRNELRHREEERSRETSAVAE